MKRLTILMILSSLVAIPLLIRKARQRIPLLNNETMRYDTEDLITDEAL
ncbi:MAG TPA: hypothetical protein VNL36_00175 [Bacteroidota bacterium]|nr:hypothetical protein [Bacteroidota bacterium]